MGNPEPPNWHRDRFLDGAGEINTPPSEFLWPEDTEIPAPDIELNQEEDGQGWCPELGKPCIHSCEMECYHQDAAFEVPIIPEAIPEAEDEPEDAFPDWL